MKNNRIPLRFATGLLLAAAAFPLTPLAAQDTGTQAQTPSPAPAESAAPQEAPTPAPSPAQTPPIIEAPTVEAQEPAAEESPAPAAEAPAERAQTQTPPARVRPRAAPQPRAQAAPTRRTAPAVLAPTARAIAPAPLPAPAPVEEFAAPPEIAGELPATAAPAPAPEALAADPAPAVAEDQQGSDMAPLLLVGLLAIAGIAAAIYFARRRRRRVDEDSYRSYPVQEEPAAPLASERQAPVPEPVAAPLAAAPVAAAPLAAAAMAAPIAAAAPADSGRPWIELLMRPIRAGVGEEDARVEFELCVDNQGSVRAEDVRISTFMLAAGSPEESQMERSLIEHAPEARLPDAIDPGQAKRIASAVALPREGLGDAILPVVIADARYRLPDGSEGHTSVAYAVGVPWEGELAHFDVENPSGLHEGVEARLRGEPQQV